MIDAFKPSYLEYAPYLKALTKEYQHGELEMGLGHWRGVQILFEGNSNIISTFYKNENYNKNKSKSSLNYLKYFIFLKYFEEFGRFIIDILFNLPRLIKGYELIRTGNIPIDKLYKFDVSINKHPGKKHRKFIYFSELDKLGHKYGTKSLQVINAIKKIDKKISELDNKNKFDLIFSDHGMADIEKIISVPITKNCFIDSDIARYWGNEEELNEIKKQLPVGYGNIIKWDKKYGQLIFLVNTGVLIFPNFWNKKPVKAMHGYDGKSKDMKAFYLIKQIGNRKDLKAEELHEILKESF